MLKISGLVRRAQLLSGTHLAAEIRRRVALEVRQCKRPPRLVVVLVGSRPDSVRYTRSKRRAAEECGIDFCLVELPQDVSQSALHRQLLAASVDPAVDAILLQLPLPPHLRARPALFHIHPAKDVDGLHPLNAGNLFIKDHTPISTTLHAAGPAEAADGDGGRGGDLADSALLLESPDGAYRAVRRHSIESQYFIPCTALGVRTLLFSFLNRHRQRTGADTADGARQGRLHAVVVNKSMTVGIPTAALLLKEPNFAVTVCSRDDSLAHIRRCTREADVVVTAYGRPRVLDRSFIREQAVVIDVAINEEVVDGRPRLCGDVDVESVMEVAAAVTPTPGGVGPMTIAYLLLNVLKAYKLRSSCTPKHYNNAYLSFLNMYGVPEPPRGEEHAGCGAGDGDDEEPMDAADNSSFDF